MPISPMPIFLFICDFALVVTIAVLLTLFIGSVSFFEYIVTLLVFMGSLVVFSAYLLSLVKAIDLQGFMLLHLLFLGIVFTVMRFRKKETRLPVGALSVSQTIKDIKGHPVVLFLGFGICIFILTSLFLGFFVLPNNWDSMTYHLSRAGYWNQYKHLGPFVTADIRQVFLPANAEILLLWPIVFLRVDILAFLPQLIAYVGTMILVYLTARFLKVSKIASFFAAFIWASLTEIMLEATTTQNDLVVTFFLMAAVYFFLKGLKEKRRPFLAISGLSLGMALGTKGIALFLLPAFCLAGFLYGFRYSADKIKLFLLWVSYSFFGFLFLGSYIYIQNFIIYGAPMGPAALVKTNSTFSLFNMIKNLAYLGWRFFDTSGLVFLKIPGFYPRASFHEDSAGYGLAWLFVCLPSFGYALYQWKKDKDFVRGVLILCVIVFICLFSASLYKDPWMLRLLIPLTAFTAPFAGYFYLFYEKGDRLKQIRKFFGILFSLVIVTQILTVSFCNPSKPLYVLPSLQKRMVFKDHVSVLQMNNYEKRYFAFSDLKLSEMDIYQEVDRRIQGKSNLGLIASGNDWGYPAFGGHFQREVFPLIFVSVFETKKEIVEKKLDYLLIFGPNQKFEDHDEDVLLLVNALLAESKQAPLLKKSGEFFLFDVRNIR